MLPSLLKLLTPHPLKSISLRLFAVATAFFLLVDLQPDLPAGIQDPLEVTDQLMADQLSSAISSSEWLGILAPVAISPFFGIACLCFMSQYGESIIGTNNFVSENPVLQEPVVLWVFVVLTLLTSLPRLTKVSKPVAQACDQIETWAGIITVIVIKVAAANATGEAQPDAATAQIVQMGFFTMSGDVLLSIAAIINIVVINTIKFFFEVMVWLTPFPFVDALLEAANKMACAGLMAIYAWSPLAATILNLLLFAACAFVFLRVRRYSEYLRAVLIDPLRSLLSSEFGKPKSAELIVFPKDEFGPFPAKAKLSLQRTDDGWILFWRRWLLPGRELQLNSPDVNLEIDRGLIINRIEVTGAHSETLLFTRRYSSNMRELSELLSIPIEDEKKAAKVGIA
ncbi:MAG: hypothetical protein AAF456_23605 [Planctomycetota bacterium]